MVTFLPRVLSRLEKSFFPFWPIKARECEKKSGGVKRTKNKFSDFRVFFNAEFYG